MTRRQARQFARRGIGQKRCGASWAAREDSDQRSLWIWVWRSARHWATCTTMVSSIETLNPPTSYFVEAPHNWQTWAYSPRLGRERAASGLSILFLRKDLAGLQPISSLWERFFTWRRLAGTCGSFQNGWPTHASLKINCS